VFFHLRTDLARVLFSEQRSPEGRMSGRIGKLGVKSRVLRRCDQRNVAAGAHVASRQGAAWPSQLSSQFLLSLVPSCCGWPVIHYLGVLEHGRRIPGVTFGIMNGHDELLPATLPVSETTIC
jgi:hypothetical protein